MFCNTFVEPPFCKSLQDSDILLVQFSLICHVQQSTGNLISNRDTNSQSGRLAGSTFDQAHGTSRLVNLLLHRFGVFDFLGCKRWIIVRTIVDCSLTISYFCFNNKQSWECSPTGHWSIHSRDRSRLLSGRNPIASISSSRGAVEYSSTPLDLLSR